MPGKPRSAGKRKQWKRKPSTKPRRRMVNVNRALQPIPQRYICKMKYAETVTSDPVTGLYRFRLNSINDPNFTGSGHQPYSHDTLATLYNRYRVIACKWRILCPRGDQNIQFASIASNESLIFTTVSEMKENPRAQYKTQMVGGNAQVISGSIYLPNLVGRTKAQYMADDRYQAEFGFNPLEAAILNVLTGTQLDIPLGNTAIQIELVYTVECFDVKNLSQS